MNLQNTSFNENEGNMANRFKLKIYWDIYIKTVKNPRTNSNYSSSFKIIENLRTTNLKEIINFILKSLEVFENNNTKNFHLKNLIVFLKWLCLQTQQFYDFKEIEYFQEPISKRQAYTRQELTFLEQELKTYGDLRFYAIWHIILKNSLRRSEFCRINWGQLKLSNFRVQIHSSKRGKDKYVRIPQGLIKWIDSLNFEMKPNTISVMFDKFGQFVLKRNPDFRKPIICHMLKHTALTNGYIKVDGNINKVQVFSGNKNANLLYDTYIQKSEAYQNKIWEEINCDENGLEEELIWKEINGNNDEN